MAVTATSTPSLTMSYTLTDTRTDRTISESATVGFVAQTFSDGTGYSEIGAGVVLTGLLPSGIDHAGVITGSGVTISMTGVPKKVFQDTILLNFSAATSSPSNGQGIKGIQVVNNYDGPSGTGFVDFAKTDLPYITVAATGAVGFSGLFGGGSGGYRVYPQSTWASTLSHGETPFYNGVAPDNYDVSLIDSGSGVPYQVMIIGNTGVLGGS